MSMELCVLSDMRLASMAEWQRAIDAEKGSLQLSAEGAVGEVNGFLPANLQGKQTGFECYHVDPHEITETYDNLQFGRAWKYGLVLVWGGDFAEMKAAWMAASAYARATSGVVFDPQASQLLTASEAFEFAHGNR